MDLPAGVMCYFFLRGFAICFALVFDMFSAAIGREASGGAPKPLGLRRAGAGVRLRFIGLQDSGFRVGWRDVWDALKICRVL